MQKRQAFDIALRQLQLKLLEMGERVQQAVRGAMDALKTLDPVKGQRVVDGDQDINLQENEIVDLCVRLIATQQPVAGDLRKIVAGMRIAGDLERMGDLAVDVAKTAVRLQGQPLIKPLIDIPRMAELCDQMVSDALHAYVQGNVALARKLAEQDDEIDHIYRKVVEDLFALSADEPDAVSQAMSLAFVGRYLERIGDHATNIGESVIYIVSGERSDLN
ncbi:phosphate signaling complex protein PhoU [Alicyclobacillus macrosporangiidus]|uniref:Phosphate-specific transport system accessory protein PhoU n=1 Tax=Alicyclobacillus macrosporangiidus TaxID=392015 RepID=A0A1I7F816_9BACL|nr:phosphate signaling complex protein PhoU [Alicyclobacillus macrosporangiidus]SFU32338.1 phosphate transport system protein [Alicyclobacillus macrosporangiidus]